MSLLSNLVVALTENIKVLEAELLTHGNGNLPHLREPHLYKPLDDSTTLPSWKAFDAVEKILVDVKALENLVTPNRSKLLSLAMAPLKASNLQTAAELGVADAIVELGGIAPLAVLAQKLEVNENKLGRIIRALAHESIFREVSPDTFANTRHSAGLLRSEGALPFLSLTTSVGGMCASGLCEFVTKPELREDFEKAPFSSTVAKNGETFMEYVMLPQNADILQNVVLGVTPWLNKTTRAALLSDYPWAELGDACVVDIGCGPADSAIDILKAYPKLRWDFQDLSPVLEHTEKDVTSQLKDIIPASNLTFTKQDYFEPNVSIGDVFYLRGVIREYTDDKNLVILNHIAAAMRKSAGSRMVINEILCPTPDITPASDVTSAPSGFIPREQSAMNEVAYLMTWNTYTLFGGYERSYRETEQLLKKAGFRVSRFFKFRSFTTMIECVLAE